MKRKQPSAPAVRTPDGIPGIKRPERKPFTGIAGTLLLVHTVLAFSVTWLGHYWQPLQRLFSQADLRGIVFSVLLMQGLLIFLPAVLAVWIGRMPADEVAGRQVLPGSLFLSLAAGVPAAVVFQGLNNLLVYLMVSSGMRLPQPAASTLPALSELLRRPWPFILLVLLVTAVIPAFAEEFFFRGVLLTSLQSAGAIRSAVFWQALAFAFFHGDAYFLLSPFLAGLLLAHVRRRCGRLWPAIMTHLTMNVSSIALAPLLPELTQSILQDHSRQATSLLYASLIAACIAAVALIPIVVLLGSRRERIPDHPAGTRRRLVIFPGDWKFITALALQIATLFLAIRL